MFLKRYIQKFTKPLGDFRWRRNYHNQELATYNDPLCSFHYIQSDQHLVADDQHDEKPIFIFSAGWRSGSTLLQRLLCSDSNTLIWGEPYDKSCLIQSLSETFLPITGQWPPDGYFIENIQKRHISDFWIASLYPNLEDLIASHREFLLHLFANTAEKEGFARWGIKEVRFGLKEALYLKILFPNSRFVFLQRNLKSAYRSYAGYSTQRNWYSRWPFRKAFSPFSFARHRSRLLNEFELAAEIVNGFHVDYGDLIRSDYNLQALEAYCGVDIDKTILSNKIGSSQEKAAVYTLSLYEKIMLFIGDRIYTN